MVRFPRGCRENVYDLEQMWVACPNGKLVPLREVARLKEGTGYTTIRRSDERRAITVRADVDQKVNSPEAVLAILHPWFRQFEREHPGLTLTPKGREREMNKSLSSLRVGFTVALVLIYITLAWLFSSYIQPLIVMLSIPLSLVGVVVGHWIMGYPLTILSMIGTVALAGIAVNDALILVSFANGRRKEGVPVFESVIQAGRRRLRPVLLTTMTTCLGLAPLMFESSFQARFLIPMAVAIVFGLLSCTFLTLVIIPCTYMVAEDCKWLLRRIWHGPTLPETAAA
jgi:multidrug efflux pump subunit AcrB